MSGYWGLPVESAAALRSGWLHTGDLGALDERGFLTLLDRAKDLIISGGSNIYPREVEEALLEDPDLAEVAVIGVPDPGVGRKRHGRAGRRPRRDARFRSPRTSLSAAHRPLQAAQALARGGRAAEELAGKVLKRELRQQFGARSRAEGNTADRNVRQFCPRSY